MKRGVWIALLFVAWPAWANTPESTIEKFYVAYASGDVNAAASFWTPDRAKTFVARSARTLRTRCQTLEALRIDPVVVRGDESTANVEARLTRWSAFLGASLESDVHHAIVTLRRQRGEWRIVESRMREEDLVERWSEVEEQRELHTPRLIRVLSKRALTMSNQENMAGAAQVIATAKSIATNLNDLGGLSEAMSVESVLLYATDPAAAVVMARNALEVAEQSGNVDAMARALLRLARAQSVVKDTEGALASAERGLALSEFVEDASTLAFLASHLARVHDENRRLRKGLHYALLSAAFAQESGDLTAILSAEMNLSGTYAGRGDFEMALPHAERVVAVAKEAGLPSYEANGLETVAAFHLQLGRGERFLELTSHAVELLKKDGAIDARHEEHASILVSRGEYRFLIGDLAGAEKELTVASELLDKVSQRSSTHRRLDTALVLLRARQQRYDEAMLHAERLRPGGEEVRAVVLQALGRKEEARRELETLIANTEQWRRDIEQQHRGVFFQGRTSRYVLLIENLLDAGKPIEALAVAERLKARALKELLATNVSPKADDDRAVARLNATVTDLNRRLVAVQQDGGDAAPIRTQLRRARAQLDQAMARIDRIAAPASEPPFDVQALELPEKTTAITFVVGQERTIAFAIRRRSGAVDVQTHVIEMSSIDLRQLVRRFTRAIEQRDERYRAQARSLHDLLLRPLIPANPSGTFCIIPDADLWTVPFHALLTPRGDHLIEHAEVFYAPSLSSLMPHPDALPSRAPTLLALGDPQLDGSTNEEVQAMYRDAALGRLPDAAAEVRELQRLYGKRASVRVGSLASEATFKAEAGEFDVLHLATHGLVDVHTPMYSALLLAGSESEDGLLEAREILSLPLRADLVVLSACDTARGGIRSGEGVVGLAWSVLAAGCPRTIVTQWRVGSAASARLMIAFHRRLAARSTVTQVARCLREAQLETLRDGRYSHPYYWAGFVLVGRND